MKKTLVILVIILSCLATQHAFSQNTVDAANGISGNIEDLTLYPNPVNSNKPIIYINSKENLSKKITCYDVLGKLLFSTIITGKELNLSNIGKGIFLLKITENQISVTRKLVIM